MLSSEKIDQTYKTPFFSAKKNKSPINLRESSGKKQNISHKKKSDNKILITNNPYYKEILTHNKNVAKSPINHQIKIKNYEN